MPQTYTVTETLKQAHATLASALRELQKEARTPSREGVAELRPHLEAARACLGEHFRFEEQNGYLDEVRRREPFAERTIEKLRAEHQELLQALAELLGEVRACEAIESALRDKVKEWIMRVRSHESRESNLIQDAFNLDFTAED